MVGHQVLVLSIGVRIPVPERMKKIQCKLDFLNERRGSEVPAHFAARMRKPERCVSIANTARPGRGA